MLQLLVFCLGVNSVGVNLIGAGLAVVEELAIMVASLRVFDSVTTGNNCVSISVSAVVELLASKPYITQ